MRVKRGFTSRRRHKRLLKLAEGFRGRKKNCFNLAKRSVERALKYSYRDRRVKKREFRGLWITRINAGVRPLGLTYSRLVLGLKKANIGIDRKILADLAVFDPQAFRVIAEQARTAAGA